jgi:hypothetical protein
MTFLMANIVLQVFSFLKKPAGRIIFLGLLCTSQLYAQPCTLTWYRDSDLDGFGTPATTVTTACGVMAPAGYTANSLDCNDALVNAKVWYPLETEVYNAVAIDPRIAIASDGTPFVIFIDYNLSRLTAAKYVNQHWSLAGTRGFTGILGDNNSISLALYSASATTTPYVSYTDQSEAVTVMSFNGTTWQQIGISFSSAVSNTDISINKTNGEPYVLFNNYNTLELFVRQFTGGIWVDVGTSLGTGVYSKMAVDATGVPYVAFSDIDNGGAITVKRYQSGAWTTVGTAGFSTADVESVQLVISASDIPYVAYFDYGDNKITVQKFSAGAWAPVGSNDVYLDYATAISLAVDHAETPYVAYVAGNAYSVKKLDQTDVWAPVSDPVTTAIGEKISVATGPDGMPYIAFGNFNNSDHISVMQIGAESCPLAVKLLYLKALAQETEIELSWATATEVNAAYFSVERSPDGKNFLPIGRVPAQLNSNKTTPYSFTDDLPLNGKNYYRLQSVDTDGSFEYSRVTIAQIERALPGQFTLYPNPNQGHTVWYTLDAEPVPGAYLQVINSLGEMVHRTEIVKQASKIVFETPLAKGCYILQYRAAGQKHMARLVVLE